MDDRKLSQFLRHLRSLAPDVPDYLFRTTWTSWLPTKVQATLACYPEVEMDAVTHCADSITETFPPPAVASFGRPIGNNELLHHIEEFSRQMADLSTKQKYSSSRDRHCSSTDSHYNPQCSLPQHQKSLPLQQIAFPTPRCNNLLLVQPPPLGPIAELYLALCLPPAKEPSAAGSAVCTTATGRLFITNKSTKQWSENVTFAV
jgi:hypothetical protein